MIRGWSRCLKCGCYTRRYSGITSEGDRQQYNLPKSQVEGYNGVEVEMTNVGNMALLFIRERIRILSIIRIECKTDRDNSISNKGFDITKTTIENLIAQGKLDTNEVLQRSFKEG